MNRELLKKNFENHGFQPSFFNTKEEAAAYLASQLQGKRIAIGGSMTVKEMNLDQLLAEKNEVIWHWNTPGRETLMKAREAEIFLTSANAVAETGEIVNIDGTGNRVSQTLYGPEKIYFIVGENKLCPDLQAAIFRARNVAAPKNAVRLHMNTPCAQAEEMRCYDCSSPVRICRSMVITERPSMGMEAEILFIGEELGY